MTSEIEILHNNEMAKLLKCKEDKKLYNKIYYENNKNKIKINRRLKIFWARTKSDLY